LEQNPDDQNDVAPEVWAHLTASLDTYRREHKALFLKPQTDEETRLHRALDEIEKHALGLVTTGQIPHDLHGALEEFRPGTLLPDKIADLLSYNGSQHAIEFEVASAVCWKLEDLSKRIQLVIFAFLLLLRSDPSPTAIKYLRQATTLYLAGYTTEVFIMCGAVLEAAMEARFPDELLRHHGSKPAYRHTGVFSLGQRMAFEEHSPIFRDDERRQLRQLITWRNDAIHIQPDLAPRPAAAILNTAIVLGAIVPRR